MHPYSKLLVAALVLFTFVFCPNSKARAEDKDMVELEHYTLTMDKAHRYQHFLADLGSYMKANPSAHESIREAIETDADKHEDEAAVERRLSANPAVAGILSKNALTAHEFVVFQSALLQAGMASAMKPANEPEGQYAAKVHMNPANLVFVREHKAELDALGKSSAEE